MAENNINNVAVEAVENAAVEAVAEKSNDLLKTIVTFAAGTGFGAGCVVIGKKIAQAVTESKDEIEATKKEAQIEKLQKKMAADQEKLAKLQASEVEEPESEVKEETGKKKTK